MYKLELTKEQMEDFTVKVFEMAFPDKRYGEFKDQPFYVKSDWENTAFDAIEGYNITVENIDFPGISVVENCCMICKHVELYRPACKLRGGDISLECVCSKFELFEFEKAEEEVYD